ncbi:ABC transporter ATP-binding protein [Aurantimonas sp. VKM B-3413]|uniref:ABC transporter ATP-binding protein n=1 Tax=Aurantimonas sp. VKM B-3413 TaxID=2779401 RepID=UPI001E5D4258|nr:ABC transporter ATP-binding protein [Aurantimonas sp. VKM B-3413]MCB8838965.1 ABC transporter ATP-binding protein [Aurantimonas sp. VKM B-3413]
MLKTLDPSGSPEVDLEAKADRSELLRLAGVRKTFKGFVAVDRVDLSVRRGEFFTLLGPSGSGKTTTLRLIAGFERPDEGRIELAGRDVARLAPFDRDVNTVFQDYALFPHMSVAENIAYGLRAKRVAREEIAARVEEALRMVQLEAFAGRSPTQLSGGQRQRVGLARAIVNRPSLLLLDEPLGALDLKLRQDMQLELKHIQEKLGIAFLYVTHDQDEALSMSDRIAVFNDGRIEQIGTPEDVYERPASEFVAGFVGTSTILERGGRQLVLRPEKIRVAPPSESFDRSGWQVESGILEDIVYGGMFTRYLVRLERGESVTAAEQNHSGPSQRLRVMRGQTVIVAFRPDGVFSLGEVARTKRMENRT